MDQSIFQIVLPDSNKSYYTHSISDSSNQLLIRAQSKNAGNGKLSWEVKHWCYAVL